jgi:hypothetical protein
MYFTACVLAYQQKTTKKHLKVRKFFADLLMPPFMCCKILFKHRLNLTQTAHDNGTYLAI